MIGTPTRNPQVSFGVARKLPSVARWQVTRVAAVVSLLLVAGCARQQAAASPGTGVVTIVWLAGPTVRTFSDDVRQILVDAFEQSHPSIKVELITGPDDSDQMRATIQQTVGMGSTTPDVYSADVVWPAEFASRRWALPLTRYLSPSFLRTFAKPGTPLGQNQLVQEMTYGPQIYGVPYFIDEGFLYYRKDLLRQAHLPVPHTWQQLVQDSTALRRDGLRYQFVWQGNNYEGLTCDWMEYLADEFGKPISDTDTAALAADMASPRALAALNFMRSLIIDNISPADTKTNEETEDDKAFDSGKAAFMRGWDESYASALSTGTKVDSRADVGVTSLPTFAGQHGPGASVVGGWNIFVNPHSRHRGADLTFAKWIAGVQAQRILAGQYSEIPSSYSVRTDPAVISQNPVLVAAKAYKSFQFRPAGTPGYQTITEAIHNSIHAALPGPGTSGSNPCLALLRAAKTLDPDVHSTLPCSQHGHQT